MLQKPLTKAFTEILLIWHSSGLTWKNIVNEPAPNICTVKTNKWLIQPSALITSFKF